MRNFNKILFNKNDISSATFILLISYILSSFLGLVRNRLFAGIFGDSPELGAFYLSDKIPSTIFALVVMSVLSFSFIPIHKKILKNGENDEKKLISTLLILFYGLYILLSLPIFVFSSYFIYLVSWGNLALGSYLNEISGTMMRLILASQFLLIFANFQSAFLNSHKRFLVPAFTTFFYNLGTILGTVLLYKYFGVVSISIGILIGTFFTLLIQIPVTNSLFLSKKIGLVFDKKLAKKLIYFSIPRTIVTTTGYLYSIFIVGFISRFFLSPSYIVVYEFSSQLYNMPITVFAVSLAQALLPNFSELAEGGEFKKINVLLSEYFQRLFYYLAPITVLFFVLKIPIIRLIYGGDNFSWLGTNLTAYTFAFFCISLIATSLSTVLIRFFYSINQPLIPTMSSFINFVLSLFFCFFFVFFLKNGLWSLALAFSLGSIAQFSFLYIRCKKYIGDFITENRAKYTPIIFFSYVIGILTYYTMHKFDTFLVDTTRTLPLLIFTLLMLSIYFLVYVLLLENFGISYFRNSTKKLIQKIIG